jgi:TonB family protein
MSVEAAESLSEVWTRWQGHVINSEFRLGRCLGSSDHSGVYLTRSAALGAADLAIKLVPTNRALAEQLLPRWKRASALTHPHLLRHLAWGGCQLEGLPYLYLVMEHADQTLAQLLSRRALTTEEARALLAPSLDALNFLHRQGLVQGQLKPTNILVVGEELKLASDTIRRVGEGAISTYALTAYDPPEGRQGNTSPAGDIWALGVTLFEALTRRVLLATGEVRDEVSPPPELAPDLRELLIRCVSTDPRRRPSIADLLAAKSAPDARADPTTGTAAETAAQPADELDARGSPAPPEDILLSMPVVAAAPAATATAAMIAAPEVAAAPAPTAARETAAVPRPRKRLVAVFAGIAVAAAAIALISRLSNSPVPPPTVGSDTEAPRETPPSTAPASAGPAAPVQGEVPGAATAIHQVIPQVSVSARNTIHGHIKVWVRVVVAPDGSVLTAVVDRSGPSSYFKRLALEAAKQWTFPPAQGPARRTMQVQFDFSRDGTTGRLRPE